MKYLVLALLFLPFGASAWTSSYNFDVINNSFCQDPCNSNNIIQFEIDTDNDVVSIAISNDLYPILFNGVEYTSGNPPNDSFSNPTYWDQPITVVGAGYDLILNIVVNNDNFTVSGTENNPNNIWGSSSGFWGDDFSTVDLTDSLQASVQATGLSIWPLLYLVGVPLAFALAYYLLDFLYYSIYLGQTSKISSQSSYLDKMVYRPYKGYNRLRSRAWNRANTMR